VGPALGVDRSIRRNVIRQARGKCQMCGRTTSEHGITLVADTSPWVADRACAMEGMWAICRDCSAGLRAYLGSLAISPETVRRASSHSSIHVRIGELLKAFGIARRTPSSLISTVAGQPSWKSRLRELRQPPFNWEVAAVRYKSPSGRLRCDYILLREGTWQEAQDQKVTDNQETGCNRPSSRRAG